MMVFDGLETGDVINSVSTAPLNWWRIGTYIKKYQRSMGYNPWDETHTTLFLGRRAHMSLKNTFPGAAFQINAGLNVLSVTWPRAKLISAGEALNGKRRIYRSVFNINDGCDTLSLQEAAARLLGYHYDWKQLLDIALHKILGYPPDAWRPFLDAGIVHRVCSVGARACFDNMRKVREALGMNAPFDVLCEVAGKKLHVERTSPAALSNSKWFELVGER